MDLACDGWCRLSSGIGPDDLCALRNQAFGGGMPGTRCLLDLPSVRATAVALKRLLVAKGLLGTSAVVVQAIAFDKTPAANWKVAWHQDLMFPFARPVKTGGFEIPCRKHGIDYARPPLAVLEKLLAARLHLDPCDCDNGPLRVSPRTHLEGIIPSGRAATKASMNGHVECLAAEGELILMKPLILHASSQATSPRNRRVLHFVYHTGDAIPEEWHRAI